MSEKIRKEFEADEIVKKKVNNNGQVYVSRDLGGKEIIFAYTEVEEDE